jgi:hypothetical protein
MQQRLSAFWPKSGLLSRLRQFNEDGHVLFLERIPFALPEANLQFLCTQQQSSSSLHKNISYRPQQDKLRRCRSDRRPSASGRLSKAACLSVLMTRGVGWFALPSALARKRSAAAASRLPEEGSRGKN